MGDMTLASLDFTGVNTSTVLHPAWSFSAGKRVHRSQTRTLAGELVTYHWGGFSAFRVPLRFVDASQRELLHHWWRERDLVLLTLDTSADLNATMCRISNRKAPLPERVQPLPDRFSGMLLLEAIDERKGLGQPFILDHPQWGQLDHRNISLI